MEEEGVGGYSEPTMGENRRARKEVKKTIMEE